MQVISWIIQFQYKNFKNINVNVHYHGIFIPNLFLNFGEEKSFMFNVLRTKF